ncbi:Cytosolic 5'-nucleotidase 3A [Hypsibius exemplaris]|uniref:5'-nucleotidase n=1 Tax=Hypsibius exemplaris TaxID=2072580 RepID=A0A1W0X4U4_HYPEX|nr:Cytosolic 5'-nucleotidase 3A [Hypsibius exemplaris]
MRIVQIDSDGAAHRHYSYARDLKGHFFALPSVSCVPDYQNESGCKSFSPQHPAVPLTRNQTVQLSLRCKVMAVPVQEEGIPNTTVIPQSPIASEKLPIPRPISMGGEEEFRSVIRHASRLPLALRNALCRDGVFIGNPGKVVALLEKMMTAGAERFQVVTDFDATLTRYHRDGKGCDSSYGVLETTTMFPPFYREEASKLCDYYYPIELDQSMSLEVKSQHMRDWWSKAHGFLMKTGLKAEWMGEMVRHSTVELRDGSLKLFELLENAGIPLLIFSAGIGDLIQEVLKQHGNFKPMIVANFLDFSEEGVVRGFQKELIHTFNKHEIFSHHQTDYFAKHEERRNVLVMGDMMGDLKMADGMRAKEDVLTVGFLNSKIQKCFPEYRDGFDIVLIDDQTHDIPISIVEAIINGAT